MSDIWGRGEVCEFRGVRCVGFGGCILRVAEGRGRGYEGGFNGDVCVFGCAWIGRLLFVQVSAPLPVLTANPLP